MCSSPVRHIDEVAGPSRPPHYLGLAPRPLYLLPLLRLGLLSALLTRECADIGWAEEFGAEMLSLEQQTRTRDAGSPSGDRDELIKLLPELVGNRWRGRELGVASYGRFGSRWRSALIELGTQNPGPPRPRTTRLLPAGKIDARAWFRQLGVPVPASVVVAGEEGLHYDDLRRQLGTPFVAQRPKGSSGAGTYLIDSAAAVLALPAEDHWLVSQYAGDTTVNFHGFVPEDGPPLVLRPSVQLTDVDGLGSGFGQYAGSDFTAPDHLSPLAVGTAERATRRIGFALAELGYLGLFGVDFAVAGDQAAALELNPRMQGSTWLLGEIELAAGTRPTMVRHVVRPEHLELAIPGGSTDGNTDVSTDVETTWGAAGGSQLIVRHTEAAARLLRAPIGGRHRLADNWLDWTAPGFGLLECTRDECVLINVPRPGAVVHPGGILARVVTRTSMTDPSGQTLNDHGKLLIDALRRRYLFTPLEQACAPGS
ncbi:MAG TPA: hypothetical protein VGH89_17070 [Pseudonocardia sp.]